MTSTEVVNEAFRLGLKALETPDSEPEPADRHREILGSIVPETGRPGIVPDAHLAALAMEHGLILHSTDRYFARFNGLRLKSPLE